MGGEEEPEQALRAFEDRVHKMVPALLVDKSTRAGLLPYDQILLASQTWLWKSCDLVAFFWQDGRAFQEIAANAMLDSTFYTTVCPAGFLLLNFVAMRRWKDDTFWARAAPYAIAVFIAQPMFLGVTFFIRKVASLAMTSTPALCILAAAECASLVCIAAIYRVFSSGVRKANDPSPSVV